MERFTLAAPPPSTQPTFVQITYARALRARSPDVRARAHVCVYMCKHRRLVRRTRDTIALSLLVIHSWKRHRHSNAPSFSTNIARHCRDKYKFLTFNCEFCFAPRMTAFGLAFVVRCRSILFFRARARLPDIEVIRSFLCRKIGTLSASIIPARKTGVM